MNLQLEGKLALVTGSTAGIGFAIAKGLAAEGARVVVNGRTDARVATALKAIRRDHPGARLDGFVADLSRAEESLSAYERFPNLEILVNNLGTYEAKPFEQITDADWHAIIETNFMSGVRLSRHFLPKMKAAGWGRIIFISSESAVNIPVEMVHYGVTKTMQLALSRGLAETTSGTVVTVTRFSRALRARKVWRSSSRTSQRQGRSQPRISRRSSSGPSAQAPSFSASPRRTR